MDRTNIDNYADFRKMVKAYARGHFRLLVIEGSHGIGKTELVKRAISGKPNAYISGYRSPIAFYEELQENSSSHILIDDIDGLLKSKETALLLKQLCDTGKQRTVSYKSFHADIKSKRLPDHFPSVSPVCVIVNSLGAESTPQNAILSRGHTINFKPTKDELHHYVGTWFLNEPEYADYGADDIYKFIGTYLPWAIDLHSRTYTGAVENNKARLNWRKILITHWKESRHAQMIGTILEMRGRHKVADIITASAKTMDKSERTAWRYWDDIKQKVPDILTRDIPELDETQAA